MTRRHPFGAVNLISDPIHGYVELTKRLEHAESAAAGLPAEDAAEDDLLDIRPGSSASGGSASSRALGGSSRRPSTRASPMASASCTRPGCGAARCTPRS